MDTLVKQIRLANPADSHKNIVTEIFKREITGYNLMPWYFSLVVGYDGFEKFFIHTTVLLTGQK